MPFSSFEFSSYLGKQLVTTSHMTSNSTCCSLSNSFPVLVPNSVESAFNPCFLHFVLLAITMAYFVFGALQTFIMKRKKFYGMSSNIIFNDIKSFPISYSIKLLLIFAQVCINVLILSKKLSNFNGWSSVYDLSSISFIANTVLLIVIIFPLHIIEVHTSVWQLFTPLTYWTIMPFVYLAFAYQNFFTNHAVIDESFGAKLVSIGLLINSAIILALETYFWVRCPEYTAELLNNNVDIYGIQFSNCFGRVTFQNLNPLITKVYRENTIKFESLPKLETSSESNILKARFYQYWNTELRKEKKSLFIPLIKAFKLELVLCFFFEILLIFASFLQPQLLKYLMAFFLKDNHQIIYGVLLSFAMTLTSVLGVVLMNEYLVRNYLLSFKIRISLSSTIYEKALRLSTKARSKRTTGDITNLISVDIGRVEYMVTKFQSFISAPLQFILCIISLYYLLGWYSLCGIAVVLIFAPLNCYVINMYEGLYDSNMTYKDARTKAVSELINSIKSIKLYSWEKPMEEKVTAIRNEKELATMATIGIFDAFLNFSWNCVPYLVSCSTFGAFALFSGKKLTSDLIFPSLTLFNLLNDPIMELPDGISAYMESKISVKRILEFLTEEEIDENLITHDSSGSLSKSGDITVEINEATFIRSNFKKTNSSDSDSDMSSNLEGEQFDEEATVGVVENNNSAVALSNVNFAARKGELTCIVGNVGSGKTTLLQAILGALPMDTNASIKPFIKVNGTTAYCPQHPWIMNASIKDNILFGHKYDENFYNMTINACELTADLEIFADGDATQVGEKGISLSGGQKARISLARAVYSRADIYLLDDVLNAVDAHVSRNIINKVLNKDGILSTKTLILSTNHIHVLEEADSIYVLDHGEISEQGSYKSLIKDNGAFSKLIEEFGKSQNSSCDEKEDVKSISNSPEDENIVEDVIFEGETNPEVADENGLVKVLTLRRASVASFKHFPNGSDDSKDKPNATGQSKEVSKKGKVGFSTYKRYAEAAKYKNVVFAVGSIALYGLSDMCAKLWMKFWAELNDTNNSHYSTNVLVGTYTFLGILAGFSSLLISLAVFLLVIINASKKIHQDLVKSILKSPMSFFETTPTGRILNRFTEDISKIDSRFPRAMSFFLKTMVRCGYVLVITVCTLPSTLVFIIILSFIYHYVQKYYVSASRETKRLLSVSRSPVFSHIHETLSGIDTIKAFKQDDRFLYINSCNLDYSSTSMMSEVWLSRWLNFRLKSISSCFLFIVATTCVISLTTSKPLGAGIAGLLITLSFQITDNLNLFVRMSVEVETSAVGVERVFEYCDLPPEKPYIVENSRPPLQWPTKGSIKFDHYSTKYNENLPPVLNDISFEINPQEKIGIVGRTGAGKSTLTLALFRIIEATEGSIFIDGLDTSKIGLFDLRSKLNIIPQDSQAFQGTVRQNLDPFYKYTDDELWNALEMAHLKKHIESMKDEETNGLESKDDSDSAPVTQEERDSPHKGLYAKITEGGTNLSSGQRQLLCLARALLNPSKILLLDEATAAVDVQTDKIVQETIRTAFNDKTILTIAHRIDTILDNDRILVLDKGQVKEFDTPANLLNDKSTIFYSLCEKGGYLSVAKSTLGDKIVL